MKRGGLVRFRFFRKLCHTHMASIARGDRLSKIIINVGRMQDDLRQMYSTDPTSATTCRPALASLEQVRTDVTRLMYANDIQVAKDAREAEIDSLFDPTRTQNSNQYDYPDDEVDPIIEAALAEAEGRVDMSRPPMQQQQQQRPPAQPTRSMPPKPSTTFDYFAPRLVTPAIVKPVRAKRPGYNAPGWGGGAGKKWKPAGKRSSSTSSSYSRNPYYRDADYERESRSRPDRSIDL